MESDAIAMWQFLKQVLNLICREEKGNMGKKNELYRNSQSANMSLASLLQVGTHGNAV